MKRAIWGSKTYFRSLLYTQQNPPFSHATSRLVVISVPKIEAMIP